MPGWDASILQSKNFGMVRCASDHSIIYRHISPKKKCIYLVVYVDDIVITGSDQDGIAHLKKYLFSHFQIKTLRLLWHFLGIEVA